jgi:hypothetical protein
MLYGNSSMGYSYSPDRRNDRVDHYNSKSQFLTAQGSRQNGYYYTPNYYTSNNQSGYYDGAGRYHKN